jgi:hypothetical protein
MEQFIRGKYEARKWIAKDWTPGSVMVSNEVSSYFHFYFK